MATTIGPVLVRDEIRYYLSDVYISNQANLDSIDMHFIKSDDENGRYVTDEGLFRWIQDICVGIDFLELDLGDYDFIKTSSLVDDDEVLALIDDLGIYKVLNNYLVDQYRDDDLIDRWDDYTVIHKRIIQTDHRDWLLAAIKEYEIETAAGEEPTIYTLQYT